MKGLRSVALRIDYIYKTSFREVLGFVVLSTALRRPSGDSYRPFRRFIPFTPGANFPVSRCVLSWWAVGGKTAAGELGLVVCVYISKLRWIFLCELPREAR